MTENHKGSFIKRLSLFAALWIALTLVFYWVVADSWDRTTVQSSSVSPGFLLPGGSTVSQQAAAPMDQLEQIILMPHLADPSKGGSLTLFIKEGETLLWETQVDASQLISDAQNTIVVDPPLNGVKSKMLTLQADLQDTGLALWAGSSVNTGRFDIAVAGDGLLVNGEKTPGSLIMVWSGVDLLNGSRFIWPVSLMLLALVLLVTWLVHRKCGHPLIRKVDRIIHIANQYKYLLKQLVWRDFRVKYKASALGMLWSFLNPLLTMLVYSFVFSTLFKSNIENFLVYLISGIVIFNAFSEASNLGLTAIVGNSSLITKVYLPKLIYPLSKVLSACVNLGISLVPLLIVMIFTGVPLQKSLLLLPVAILFLLLFSFGVSLLLSTLNVFFRDTQFLWTVFLTMLNFLTPVFYPESIIPAEFITLYHMNPMYQILYFMRTITLGGVSPTPVTYLYCILVSVIPLILGLWVFRKNQDKFVLHL